ncbi:hypothetical protein A3F27_02460 [Candidatus Kaiserbacteria bacterium RIFCSPHIGHO2_12_FULL_53_13]|uniref:Cell shape-determining protein MreC n=1 Tax=Candidatus Kaiserbacteria bacterium RIFCSPHIGHO2_12_FULL_53_13 TaxID=1798502 RepID=A0A1F6EC51_9BACT|nr:MAG: hypothetical protein A3F27_02460 [Candidatus Kaiserbacteria bacterium RIFCSPHIGHO2_12_FULL_53_13]OGG74486.1 MAG: hypothetical protein A3A37_01505 [Candidatus Kaiserbacteria bacterium RIFCSPLOWO2_01_FULL_52_36]
MGPGRERKRLIAASALVIVLFVFDIFSGGQVRAQARDSVSSVWKLGVSAGKAVRGSGFFSSRAALEKENAALKDQLARSQVRAAAYQALKDENAALRGMLRISENELGITAPVVSSFRASPYGTFLVGAGSSDAVTPGSLVLTEENFVIGRVADVSPHSALVNELFAPNVSTDALIRGAGVSVDGQGGGNARANVPREVQVEIGDPVTSPVLKGRTIGVVGAVEEDPASAYKRVYIRLPVNLAALQFVYLLKQ